MEVLMKYAYHKGIVPLFKPNENCIFVFGSNLAGRHGKGAALIAKQRYGAIYGIAEGFQGNSYAIPTKDRNLQTLSLDKIKEYVDDFKNIANLLSVEGDYTAETFYVTRIGCGLAGYRDWEIAPMFANSSGNCIFDEKWEEYLE